MRTLRTLRMPVIASLCSAILLLPGAATAQQTEEGEDAIQARQGFMRIVVIEAGPLFAMAKGDIAYDAETAATHAEQLNAIIDYDVGRQFIPGTTKANYTGDTRALADIWEEPEAFREAYQDLQDQVAAVAEQAGQGHEALAAAVQELGQACGNCHDDFRADEF